MLALLKNALGGTVLSIDGERGVRVLACMCL